jgi:hypothetical protein
MSWLDHIRTLGAPKARHIRELSVDELILLHGVNQHSSVSSEIKRLDQSLRNLWLMCAMTFLLIVCVTLYICSR